VASTTLIATIMLVGVSLAAAYTDLARRRISNVMTFGLAAAALGLSSTHGALAFAVMLATYVAFLVVYTVPFSRGWIGGGDVKLIAAGAVCAGWPGLVSLLLITSVAGGILALIELARARRLHFAMMQLATAAYVGGLGRGVILEPGRSKLPYALAILTGALYLLASETFAPWLQLVHG
jgi:prepilin peptidase CpaA